jgi:hypothetical protein
MNVAKYLSISFVAMTFLYACETPKIAQKTEIVDSDDLIIKLIDSVDFSTLRMDTSGDGLFGRKIIYRDMSAAKSATLVSGRVGVKVCINKEGIVKYAEIIQDSSTIKDVRILKKYLKASCGYKFQPNPDAPDYECGRMRFTIKNTSNYKFR